ncbi:DsrH/TusB family sulfur metabolism protein [Rheinheimera sp. WS51]|uniref:DsrH/TusB family sulfur metabolism protein n=1 Tax=Rheinheimera sp. WS51 TaxID=3425886 RepID=UPI003D8F1DC3
MILYTLTSASINLAELELVCANTDAILLRQDAVYLLKRKDLTWPTKQLFALDLDLRARNIKAIADFKIITAKDWVELTIQANQNILWQHLA